MPSLAKQQNSRVPEKSGGNGKCLDDERRRPGWEEIHEGGRGRSEGGGVPLDEGAGGGGAEEVGEDLEGELEGFAAGRSLHGSTNRPMNDGRTPRNS